MAPTRMQVQCQNCHAGNLPGSPYCSSCGAPLGDKAPQVERFANGTVSRPAPIDPVTQFASDGQDRALVKQTYERAAAILTQGESIEYIATARGGLTHAPDCAVATNKRVMLFKKKVLGKVELDDCWWRDIGAASLADSKSGVTLKLDAIQGWHMMIENVPKTQAGRLYDIAFQYSDRLKASRQGTGHAVGESQEPVAAAPAPATPAAPASSPRQSGTLPSLMSSPLSSGLSPLQVVSNASSGGEGHALQSAPLTPLPSNYIPTPESVLQSILQSSALEEDGVPTRPMQWSAAAFQAPAMTEAQSVVLTGNSNVNNTDTEPQMRALPPLTTLERIAVFTSPSGPLAVDGSQRPSTPLHSTPLTQSGPLQSGPMLDAADLIGSLSDSGALAFHEGYSVEMSAVPEAVGVMPRPVMPTGPIEVNATNTLLVTSSPLANVESNDEQATYQEALMGWAEEMPAVADPVAEAVEIQAEAPESNMPTDTMYDEGFSNARPTAPMGSEDYLLPMPGSTASGPLLAASADMDADLEELYRNTSAMATQRLAYEAQTEQDDLATRINLSLRNTPSMQSSPSARNSGALGRGGSTNGQHSTDELKNARSNGSRGTGSSRSKTSTDDPIAKMKQLKTLLDAGLITEEDYASKKADILARI